MATFQDFDWAWLKETSQQLANAGFSSLHKLFEPGYIENLLGPTASDAICGLVGNEYLSTGAFLLICGSLLGPSHAAISHIQSRLWKTISVSVTIEEKDEVYQAVEEFLTDLAKDRGFNNLIASTRVGPNIQTPYNARNDSAKLTVQYAPGYGRHSIRFKGQKIRIQKEFQGPQVQYDGPSTSIPSPAYLNGNKVINLWTLSRNPSCLQDLVGEAAKSFQKKYEGKVQIYQYIDSYKCWSSCYFKEARDLDSVVLPVGLKEDLIQDMKLFFETRSLYRSQYIPYRRTYLLEGPPGTGKSSLIQALASHFRMNICTINLSDPTLTESTLNSMMNTIPLNSMILIEDVDALAARSRNMHNGLSWCGLLNCLDGVASQEGAIVFMTTNSIEVLDGAVLRPGRVDKRVAFSFADDFQIRQLFSKFFGRQFRDTNVDDTSKATYGSFASLLGMKRKASSLDNDNSRKSSKITEHDLEFYSRCFANYIRPYTVSPAELQAFFLNHRDDDIADVAHKGNEFLNMVKSIRPVQQQTSSQTLVEEKSLISSSQATPLRLNVSDAIVASISHATPTRIIYEREEKQGKISIATASASHHEVQANDSSSSSDDELPVVDEPGREMSGQEDEVQNECSADEPTGDNEDESEVDSASGSDTEREDSAETEAETDEDVQKRMEYEVENGKVDGDEVQRSSTIDTTSALQPAEDDVDSEIGTEKAQIQTEDSKVEEQTDDLQATNEDDKQTSKENQAVSEETHTESDHSEVDLTPAGKQIESMPAFPSPKKQERVVADVLKYKMSRGLSFLEATDIIFKEGIQGIDAAVINRVLGEKSVTPIKKTVHRTPSFKSRRAGIRLNRRLKKERSQQKLAADENEWRGENLTETENENENKDTEILTKTAVPDQKPTTKARTKVHHSNDSPLRKFASFQKQTSLRKAANLPRRASFKSLKKSPKAVAPKSDADQESSEYDSGTERARKDLDDFLQKNSNSTQKHLKTERRSKM